MALNTDQKSSKTYKKMLFGVAETSTSRDFFEEPIKSKISIAPNQIWADYGLIPSTAPIGMTNLEVRGVVKRYIDLTLTAVAGTTNSFYSSELQNCIPFNFDGGGSYNYSLKSSTNATINFGQGDWVVDTDGGVLTFYGTVPSNMPPKLSFYKYVGGTGFTAATGGTSSTFKYAETYLTATTSYYIAPTGSNVTGDGSVGNPFFSFHKILSDLPYFAYTGTRVIIYYTPGYYDYSTLDNVIVGAGFEIDNYDSISIIPNTSAFTSWFTPALSSGTFSSIDSGQTIHYNSSVTYTANDFRGKFIHAKSFYGTATLPTQHYTAGGQCLSNQHIPILSNTSNSIETAYVTTNAGNDSIFGYQNIKDYDVVDLATTFYFGTKTFKIKNINRCTFYITAAHLKFDLNTIGYSLDATPDPVKINNTNGFIYNSILTTYNYVNTPVLSYRNSYIYTTNIVEPKNVIGCSIVGNVPTPTVVRIIQYDTYSNSNFLYKFNNMTFINATTSGCFGVFVGRLHSLISQRNKFSNMGYAIRIGNNNGNRVVDMMNEHVIDNVRFFFYTSNMSTTTPFNGTIFDNATRPFSILGTPVTSNWTDNGTVAYNGNLSDFSNGRIISILTKNFEGRSPLSQYNSSGLYRSGETTINDDVLFNNIKDITASEAFNYSKWKPINNQLTVSTANRILLTNNIKSGVTVYDTDLKTTFRRDGNEIGGWKNENLNINIGLNNQIIFNSGGTLTGESYFTINNKNVVIGNNIQQPTNGTMLYVTGQDDTVSRITLDSYGIGIPTFTIRRARGNNATPTAVQADDGLGGFAGYGYATSGFSSGGRAFISFKAAENFTDTNQGAYFTVSTTQTYTTSTVERFRIEHNGNVGIGTTTLTDSKLKLGGNATGGVSIYGIRNEQIIKSDITTQYSANGTNISTEASSFTLTALYHFRAEQSTIGSGSTVSSQMGFIATSSLIGAVNNYGFYGNIAAGANRWNLYMNGTANNHLNGSLGIGVTVPKSKLQVNGGVQCSDDTDVASVDKVGTTRYRVSGNNSYCDMCMQTSDSTYAWVNIITNAW